eukprot:m.359947 g.359947  ORF g.359947 m.359947 type:complete len:363 (-) comp16634_c1_seq2:93-1181(-)
MRHVAAYLLAQLGGNASPDAAAVKKIIEAGGGSVDDASLTLLLEQLKGKSVEDIIKEGIEKLADVPSGGGGGGGGGFVNGTAARWNDRGFCFIRPEDGTEDVFCHFSSITDGDRLEEGSKVEYKRVYDDRKGKYRAEEVTGGVRGPPGGGGGGGPPGGGYGGGGGGYGGGGPPGRHHQNMRPGDWICPDPSCANLNFASRSVCRMCPIPRPAGVGPPGMHGGGGGGGGGFPRDMRPGDWICPNKECNNHNFASRIVCRMCNAPKPEGAGMQGGGHGGPGGMPPPPRHGGGPPGGYGGGGGGYGGPPPPHHGGGGYGGGYDNRGGGGYHPPPPGGYGGPPQGGGYGGPPGGGYNSYAGGYGSY